MTSTHMDRGVVMTRLWRAERSLTFVFSTNSSVKLDQKLSTFHQGRRSVATNIGGCRLQQPIGKLMAQVIRVNGRIVPFYIHQMNRMNCYNDFVNIVSSAAAYNNNNNRFV